MMEAKFQRPKRRDGVVSSLSVAIEAVNLAREISSVTPTKAVFGAVSALLAMIRVCPLFYDETPQAHVCPGLDVQQIRPRRARIGMRQYL